MSQMPVHRAVAGSATDLRRQALMGAVSHAPKNLVMSLAAEAGGARAGPAGTDECWLRHGP